MLILVPYFSRVFIERKSGDVSMGTFFKAFMCFSIGFITMSVFCEPIIIDHKCTDVSKVPPEAITRAKALFKVSYGHTSHGSQIVSGMKALMKSEPKLYSFGNQALDGSLLFFDCTPKGDLGNPDRMIWAQRTREFLNGQGKDCTLVMWSWCGQSSNASEKDIETYLDLMSSLEKDFPKVKFVYMTGHLDGSGKNGNHYKRSEQIRKFCKKKGKILFDFADIESYDPDGKMNYMERNATDACNYRDGNSTRNWAEEWVKENPTSKIALPEEAAHTHPLNGALKGRAFWWMLARLAGWKP